MGVMLDASVASRPVTASKPPRPPNQKARLVEHLEHNETDRWHLSLVEASSGRQSEPK